MPRNFKTERLREEGYKNKKMKRRNNRPKRLEIYSSNWRRLVC